MLQFQICIVLLVRRCNTVTTFNLVTKTDDIPNQAIVELFLMKIVWVKIFEILNKLARIGKKMLKLGLRSEECGANPQLLQIIQHKKERG